MPLLLSAPPTWLAPCVAAALAGQLAVAGVVVARPQPVPVTAPVTPSADAIQERPAVPSGAAADVPGSVVLAAPLLWRGDVEAEPLATGGNGALAVPDTAGGLGWWADGPRPGDPGAAVVVGHVDLDGRSGVLAKLADVAPGTEVSVRTGGRVVTYRVTTVRRYAKSAFPTDAVYAPTTDSVLRLVTCGGRFDRRTGHYEDNVVVEAVVADVRSG